MQSGRRWCSCCHVNHFCTEVNDTLATSRTALLEKLLTVKFFPDRACFCGHDGVHY